MQNITALFAAYDVPFWHFSKKAIKLLKRRHAIRKSIAHEI
jgi:hypothetical protein